MRIIKALLATFIFFLPLAYFWGSFSKEDKIREFLTRPSNRDKTGIDLWEEWCKEKYK